MSTDYGRQIANHLLQIKAIRLNAKNPFTWASGIKSPIYCDNRISLSYPYVRNDIKLALANASTLFPSFDVVAGVATAGIPHGTLLADILGLPFVYVRSKAKKHGRRNLIEGKLTMGQRVLVVEDLISTGGSSMQAITALQEAKAEIVGLLAIFTYEMDFASSRFEEHHIQVETLTNYTTLMEVAMEENYIDSDDLKLLKSWRESPSKWGDAVKR
ncbi:MAG: orotate phosphoribosyltransferase [Saprospiraceae bacterium]|nr:orotate phosphoribosyltransferase [Saprospiraceae bacterium]